ncbi:MAG TPA: type II toxin-antitoxin system HicB family antitoxin [Spirochaetota bacterium]|nr:type II toxin-antitoxin system HicB family antitoxin [Spirochaetota bacterium]
MSELLVNAVIERDPETGLYVGTVPGIPGAHTQGETLDELNANLREVIALCIEEMSEEERKALPEFIGTQTVRVAV